MKVFVGIICLFFGANTISASLACPDSEDSGGKFISLDLKYCYMVYNSWIKWTAGRDMCAQKGGVIAQLHGMDTPQINRTTYRGMFQTLRDTCTCRIGASDPNNTGHWQWHDGSPLVVRNWDRTGQSIVFVSSPINCGALCEVQNAWLRDTHWVMSRRSCDQRHPVVCQFAVKNKPGPPSLRRTRPLAKANKNKIVRRVQSCAMIAEKPLFRTRVQAVTMCARLCEDPCKTFNFNSVTKECLAFTVWNSDLVRKMPNWEIWEVA